MELEISFNLSVGTRFDEAASVYVGWCPALNVRSQGETEQEARVALEDALFLFLKHSYSRNILDDTLNANGFHPDEGPGSTRGDGDGDGNHQVISVREIGHGYSDYNLRVPFNLIQQAKARSAGTSCR